MSRSAPRELDHPMNLPPRKPPTFVIAASTSRTGIRMGGTCEGNAKREMSPFAQYAWNKTQPVRVNKIQRTVRATVRVIFSNLRSAKEARRKCPNPMPQEIILDDVQPSVSMLLYWVNSRCSDTATLAAFARSRATAAIGEPTPQAVSQFFRRVLRIGHGGSHCSRHPFGRKSLRKVTRTTTGKKRTPHNLRRRSPYLSLDASLNLGRYRQQTCSERGAARPRRPTRPPWRVSSLESCSTNHATKIWSSWVCVTQCHVYRHQDPSLYRECVR